MVAQRPGEHFSWLLRAPAGKRATIGLIVLNVLVFGVQKTRGAGLLSDLNLGAMQGVHVHAGEPWRLVTACFLHGGVLHLAFNMLALYGFLGLVEEYAGSAAALCIYLLTGAAGFAMTAYFQPVVTSLGASGAINGAIGVTLCIYAQRYGGIRALYTHPACVSLLVQLVFWTWFSIRTGSNVDHYAHGGGFALGLVIGWALTDNSPLVSRLAPVLVATAAMLYVGCFPPQPPAPAEVRSALSYGALYTGALKDDRGGVTLQPARGRKLLSYACRCGDSIACDLML